MNLHTKRGRLEKASRAGIESGTTEYYSSDDKDLGGEYPLTGRVKTTEDASGNVTRYEYQIEPEGAWGYPHWVEKRITTRNDGTANEIEVYSIVDALGRTLESKSERGVTTKTYRVEAERRETTETWVGGENLNYSTTLSNADGSQKESRVWYANAGGERITKYAYDDAGRLVRTDYPDGSFSRTWNYPLPEGEQWLDPLPEGTGIEGWQGRAEVQLARDGKVSVTKYDLAGRVAESYTLASDAEGRLHLSGSATEYNEKGQSVKSYRLTGVDGSTEKTLVSSSTYDTDGRLVTSKDELTDAETAYGYDVTGRQVWTRSMQATDTPGQYVYTANEYESQFGRLVRVHYGLTSEPGGCSAYEFWCKDQERGRIPPVWRAFQRLKGAKAR